MLHALNRSAQTRSVAVVAGLAGILLLAACCRPALAQETQPREPLSPPEATARDLADEVIRRAGADGEDSLGEWTRRVIERALDRAGEAARQTVPGSAGPSTAPLPAERHAGALAADRPNTAEILIFTSLSVPSASWRQWASEAAKTGVPLVLRGVSAEGMRATVREIGARLGGAEAGVAIDPRLFRLFGVTRVPAVVVVPGGVPACRSRGCADDPAPPHDRVSGNIGLVAALEAVADEGDAGRSVAQGLLERLRGNDRPLLNPPSIPKTASRSRSTEGRGWSGC